MFYRGTSHGHAQPHAISRHCHPKVKQAPQAVPAVTGIDYLQLLEDKRAAADGTAHSISYASLAPQPPGTQTTRRPVMINDAVRGYFGFERLPFDRSIPVGALFASASHQEAAGRIAYGIDTRQITVITGEVGLLTELARGW